MKHKPSQAYFACRFPTVANVELSRLAREQRMKRGERLEASKSRFGNREDRQRTRPKDNNKERSKPTNKKKGGDRKSQMKRKRKEQLVMKLRKESYRLHLKKEH